MCYVNWRFTLHYTAATFPAAGCESSPGQIKGAVLIVATRIHVGEPGPPITWSAPPCPVLIPSTSNTKVRSPTRKLCINFLLSAAFVAFVGWWAGDRPRITACSGDVLVGGPGVGSRPDLCVCIWRTSRRRSCIDDGQVRNLRLQFVNSLFNVSSDGGPL